jgi:chromosome segregation ATPase
MKMYFMRYILIALSLLAFGSSFAQTKKEQIEKLEKEVYELKENFNKVNTKSVILEEKLKFAEKEISSLNKQIAALQLLLKPLEENYKTRNDNSKKPPIAENSGYYSSENQKEESKPTQSVGQCQATTKTEQDAVERHNLVETIVISTNHKTTNLPQFIDSHINTIRANNGNPTFIATMNRLLQIINIIKC